MIDHRPQQAAGVFGRRSWLRLGLAGGVIGLVVVLLVAPWLIRRHYEHVPSGRRAIERELSRALGAGVRVRGPIRLPWLGDALLQDVTVASPTDPTAAWLTADRITLTGVTLSGMALGRGVDRLAVHADALTVHDDGRLSATAASLADALARPGSARSIAFTGTQARIVRSPVTPAPLPDDAPDDAPDATSTLWRDLACEVTRTGSALAWRLSATPVENERGGTLEASGEIEQADRYAVDLTWNAPWRSLLHLLPTTAVTTPAQPHAAATPGSWSRGRLTWRREGPAWSGRFIGEQGALLGEIEFSFARSPSPGEIRLHGDLEADLSPAAWRAWRRWLAEVAPAVPDVDPDAVTLTQPARARLSARDLVIAPHAQGGLAGNLTFNVDDLAMLLADGSPLRLRDIAYRLAPQPHSGGDETDSAPDAQPHGIPHGPPTWRSELRMSSGDEGQGALAVDSVITPPSANTPAPAWSFGHAIRVERFALPALGAAIGLEDLLDAGLGPEIDARIDLVTPTLTLPPQPLPAPGNPATEDAEPANETTDASEHVSDGDLNPSRAPVAQAWIRSDTLDVSLEVFHADGRVNLVIDHADWRLDESRLARLARRLGVRGRPRSPWGAALESEAVSVGLLPDGLPDWADMRGRLTWRVEPGVWALALDDRLTWGESTLSLRSTDDQPAHLIARLFPGDGQMTLTQAQGQPATLTLERVDSGFLELLPQTPVGLAAAVGSPWSGAITWPGGRARITPAPITVNLASPTAQVAFTLTPEPADPDVLTFGPEPRLEARVEASTWNAIAARLGAMRPPVADDGAATLRLRPTRLALPLQGRWRDATVAGAVTFTPIHLTDAPGDPPIELRDLTVRTAGWTLSQPGAFTLEGWVRQRDQRGRVTADFDIEELGRDLRALSLRGSGLPTRAMTAPWLGGDWAHAAEVLLGEQVNQLTWTVARDEEPAISSARHVLRLLPDRDDGRGLTVRIDAGQVELDVNADLTPARFIALRDHLLAGADDPLAAWELTRDLRFAFQAAWPRDGESTAAPDSADSADSAWNWSWRFAGDAPLAWRGPGDLEGAWTNPIVAMERTQASDGPAFAVTVGQASLHHRPMQGFTLTPTTGADDILPTRLLTDLLDAPPRLADALGPESHLTLRGQHGSLRGDLRGDRGEASVLVHPHAQPGEQAFEITLTPGQPVAVSDALLAPINPVFADLDPASTSPMRLRWVGVARPQSPSTNEGTASPTRPAIPAQPFTTDRRAGLLRVVLSHDVELTVDPVEARFSPQGVVGRLARLLNAPSSPDATDGSGQSIAGAISGWRLTWPGDGDGRMQGVTPAPSSDPFSLTIDGQPLTARLVDPGAPDAASDAAAVAVDIPAEALARRWGFPVNVITPASATPEAAADESTPSTGDAADSVDPVRIVFRRIDGELRVDALDAIARLERWRRRAVQQAGGAGPISPADARVDAAVARILDRDPDALPPAPGNSGAPGAPDQRHTAPLDRLVARLLSLSTATGPRSQRRDQRQAELEEKLERRTGDLTDR